MKTGHWHDALMAAAGSVRDVQFARESMATYRRIQSFLEAHESTLASHIPDGQSPSCFALFVGQSRSGHSLVGSLIDAHPHAVIAHEIHALKHLLNGVSFDELCSAIKLNAHLFDALGRAYTGYDYAVPGQFQGRYETLSLIGDKKGNGTTRLLRRRPDSLDWLDRNLALPTRFINVIRNPFDNIATKASRTGVSLPEAARRFLANARTLEDLVEKRPKQVKPVYLEDLIKAPKTVLANLLTWLDLDPDPPGYLEACSSLIFDRPKRTGREVDWPQGLVESLRLEMTRMPQLARFADEPL